MWRRSSKSRENASRGEICRLPSSNKMTRFPLRSYFTLRLRETRSSSSDARRRATLSHTRTKTQIDTFHFKATFTFCGLNRFSFIFFLKVISLTDRRRERNHRTRASRARATYRQTKNPVLARDQPSPLVSYESCGRRECTRSRPAGEPGSIAGFRAVSGGLR